MRKAGFILTLSLITVFFTGHFFIYKSLLKVHKREFKAYIRSHFVKAEQIEINPAQLYADNSEMQWLDDNKEVCLNGVMYDILNIEQAGTKIILHAVKDTDEKELMDRYRDQFNDQYENGARGKKNNNVLKELLSFKYLQTAQQKTLPGHTAIDHAHHFISKTSSGYLTVISPPPNA